MALQTCGKPVDTLLERVLSMNILSSDYFKGLFRLKTYHEVIDEIYNEVSHVEPWMSGNCRGPSTAFCLLYKFFTMKLTVKQVQGLLTHQDSPYIRAIGFLYLRYMAEPKTLWGWFEPYLEDPEEFSPGSTGKQCTMGLYIRDLMLGQYYFDSLFPRIPVLVMRQVAEKLEKMRLPVQPSGHVASTNRGGSDEGARRPPSVKAALSVSFGQRAPHRASTRDSSPVRRSSKDGDAPVKKRAEEHVPSPSRSRSPLRPQDAPKSGRDDRGTDRDRERYGSRERERSRERDRDRDRDRERGRRDRDWERDRDRGRYDDREQERDRGGDRSKDRNGYRDQDRDRDTEKDRDRGRDSERERSRTPQAGDAGRGGSSLAQLQKLRDLYGDTGGAKAEGAPARRSSEEGDVIRLGGHTWR